MMPHDAQALVAKIAFFLFATTMICMAKANAFFSLLY